MIGDGVVRQIWIAWALATAQVGWADTRAPKAEEMTTQEALEELEAAVLSSADPARIRELQQTLAQGGGEAASALSSLLGHRDLRVSEAAADALQAIGSEEAYDTLVAYTLRHLDDPTGQTKLPGPGWRRLRLLGRPVLPALGRAHRLELPFEARLAMVFIVQQIGDPAGLPLLESALRDADPRLVEAAAEALGGVGGSLAYPRLMELLHSPEPQHRLGAIRGLGLLGNAEAVEPLLEVLQTDDRRCVQWGPARTGSPPTLRKTAADAIDTLAGERLGGDVPRIQAWIEKHRRRR